jgi:hypothetical protein
MGYLIALIVVAVVILAAWLVRRSNNKRGVSYAPDPSIRPGIGGGGQFGARPGPGAIPQVAVPTPEFKTEEIAHDEFKSDVNDDLLDPRNPNHAAWVKEHPGLETNSEWSAEHSEDNPT